LDSDQHELDKLLQLGLECLLNVLAHLELVEAEVFESVNAERAWEEFINLGFEVSLEVSASQLNLIIQWVCFSWWHRDLSSLQAGDQVV